MSCCCSRLKAEWQLSMFSLEDTTGQTIDLKQALAPKPTLLYGAIKCFILCWFIIYCIIDIVTDPYAGHWFIFLTNWGIMLMYFYMVATTFGYIRTMYLEKFETQKETENNNNTFLTQFISTVGVLAINIEVLIISIYWLTIYEDGEVITFQNLQKHGILGVLVLFDKLVVHRMPIRFKQIFLVYAFSIIYAIWSAIHAVSGIGHPFSDNDPETDDDAIYPTVNWIKRPRSAAIMTLFLLIIVIPIIFFSLLGLSTLIKPRYYSGTLEEVDKPDNEDQTDEEERVVYVY